jgi:hypothetical protein
MIHVLYFTGGANLLSVCFHRLFPTGFGDNGHGTMEHEVPIAMVALVAMAVSEYLSIHVSKLTLIASCMHPSMSGTPAYASMWSSQQVHISMFIMAMSTHFGTFRMSVAMLITL